MKSSLMREIEREVAGKWQGWSYKGAAAEAAGREGGGQRREIFNAVEKRTNYNGRENVL